MSPCPVAKPELAPYACSGRRIRDPGFVFSGMTPSRSASTDSKNSKSRVEAEEKKSTTAKRAGNDRKKHRGPTGRKKSFFRLGSGNASECLIREYSQYILCSYRRLASMVTRRRKYRCETGHTARPNFPLFPGFCLVCPDGPSPVCQNLLI